MTDDSTSVLNAARPIGKFGKGIYDPAVEMNL
jgi:hypothetical protein